MNDIRSRLLATIKKAPIFSGLSEGELNILTSLAVRKLYGTGELLFAEGEPCPGLHIVSAGRVRIYKTSASGREQLLAVEGPGSSIAELPVFDGGPFPASSSALEDSEIVFISRNDFRRFCLEHPEVSLKVLSVVGARLRNLVGIIEQLSFTTVRQRLASVLLQLAENSANRTERGIAVQLPGSHQDLATQIGTVRELVSRNMSRLQAEEILTLNGRDVVIKNVARLREVAEESQ